VLSCTEDEASVSRSLQQLLRSKPAVIMIASTTAPAGPEDVVGRAMEKVGGHVERFLAPVEPGNLLLLSYKDDIPMISAPGCFRSAKANVVDLVLPPLLARYRVSGWEVGCLGHGGLLGIIDDLLHPCGLYLRAIRRCSSPGAFTSARSFFWGFQNGSCSVVAFPCSTAGA
jgi:hypothetical protein